MHIEREADLECQGEDVEGTRTMVEIPTRLLENVQEHFELLVNL